MTPLLLIYALYQVCTYSFNGTFRICHGYNYFRDTLSDSVVLDCNLLSDNVEYKSEQTAVTLHQLEFNSGVKTFQQYALYDAQDIAARYTLLQTDLTYAMGQQTQLRQEMLTALPTNQHYLFALYTNVITFTASLNHFSELYWDKEFIADVFSLPSHFSSDDIEIYIQFWQTYGTHILQTAKFGGRISGVVIVDKCTIDKVYKNADTFGKCLTTQFQTGDAQCDTFDKCISYTILCHCIAIYHCESIGGRGWRC